MLRTVLGLLSAATSIYMLLCVVRVFMSWLPSARLGKPAELVERATEPYLSWWRRFPVLRSGGVDFSPIAALAALSGLSRLFTVASYGGLSLGVVLALVVEVAWSPFGFLLGFFAVLVIARIVAYAARWNSLNPLWRAIDAMINPVLFRIKRFVYKDRIVNYMQGLITGAVALVGARVLLGMAFGLVIGLLQKL